MSAYNKIVQAQYYANHREEKRAHRLAYHAIHREEEKIRRQAWYALHQEERKTATMVWKRSHPEQVKAWRIAHIKEYKEWKAAHPEEMRLYAAKWAAIRRTLGFLPINQPFNGCEAHHLDHDRIVYIPAKLHKSMGHNVWTGRNMEQINALAFQWLGQNP